MMAAVGMTVAEAQFAPLRVAGAPPEQLREGQIAVARSGFLRGTLDLNEFEERLDLLCGLKRATANPLR